MTKKNRKPQIRFAGFHDTWEQRKLSEILIEHNIRTSDFENNPLYSLTIESGITPKTERYERNSLVTKTEDLFKVVKPNEFVTNPMNLRFGALGYNTNPYNISVSGYYDVFSIDNDRCSGFWNSYFKTPIAMKIFNNAAIGSLIEKRRVKYSTLQQLDFYMPKALEEKVLIGRYMDFLDNLITLHQRKLVKLTNIKKSMLDKLFPKNGSSVPEIRFRGFTEAWEQRKLSEITDKVTEKNSGLQYVEIFTNSAEFGIISQRDFFDHDIAKLSSLDGYYIVKNEDFVYNPRISTSAPVGPINRNKLGRTGVVSPLYTVFRPHDVDTTYLEHFFKCVYWHSFMNFNGDSGARSDRFSIKDDVFFQMSIPLPHIDEQKKIGELLTCLDNLITLHQRKLEKLKNLKKACLEKMFV